MGFWNVLYIVHYVRASLLAVLIYAAGSYPPPCEAVITKYWVQNRTTTYFSSRANFVDCTASLWSRGPGLSTKSDRVGFMVDRVAPRLVLLQVLRCFSRRDHPSNAPYLYFFNCRRRCIIVAVYSVIKENTSLSSCMLCDMNVAFKRRKLTRNDVHCSLWINCVNCHVIESYLSQNFILFVVVNMLHAVRGA